MSPTAQLMIHNVWSYAEGDYKEFEKEAEVLKSHNESIANAYMIKTGKDKEELLALMDKESYFNAREAKEAGLIDEIMFDEGNKIAASLKSDLLPDVVINKMRNHFKNEKQKIENEEKVKIASAKLNLLKLMEVRG